jgi:DNA-binding GntR family transcriptional regulator
MLAGRGVLDLLPDRGAVMRPLTPRDVVQIWQVITPTAAVGLDLAARVIAAGGDPSNITAKFDTICHEPLKVSPLTFILRLNEYHFAVHDLAGNPYLTIVIDRLGVPYWDRYLVELIDVRAHVDGYLTNYRRMHEAVLAGDGPAASAVMHYHAAWSIELVRRAAANVESTGRGRRARHSGG